MPIYSSKITTAANTDLTIDPEGIGEIKLNKLSGNGELPLGVADSDGEVRAFDHRNLNQATVIDPGDLLMVQRQNASTGETEYYSIDAENLGGADLSDLNPPNVSWLPSDPPGSGTQGDPYRLTPVDVTGPGQVVSSVETMIISGLNANAIVPFWDESSAPASGRFEQDWVLCDENGDGETKFRYVDAPATTSGIVYNGVIKAGSSSVYITWEVKQIASKTVFGPEPAPTASPTSVFFPEDRKYGTVEASWTDGAKTLEATNLVFSVGNSSLNSLSKGIVDNDRIVVGFSDSVVAAANDGDLITGTLSSTDGTYYSEMSMVKDTAPNNFSFGSVTDAAVNLEASTPPERLRGFNAPTTITATGSGSNALGDVKISINGGTPTVVSGATLIPGETIKAYGTTGGVNSTSYEATVEVGGVSASWSVTTSDTQASITKPAIISPVNGSTDIDLNLIIQSSAYTGVSNPGPHTKSSWEVYKGGFPLTSSNQITNVVENGITFENPVATGVTNYSGSTGFLVNNNRAFWCTSGTNTHPQFIYQDLNPITGSWSSSGNWVAPADPNQFSSYGYNSIAANGNTIILVGQTGNTSRPLLFRSTDNGNSWSQINVDASPANFYLSVAYRNGRFVVLGRNQYNNNTLPISYSDNDGVTWTHIEQTGLQYPAYGQGLIAVESGFIYQPHDRTAVYSSTNGTNFQELGSYTGTAGINQLAAGKGDEFYIQTGPSVAKATYGNSNIEVMPGFTGGFATIGYLPASDTIVGFGNNRWWWSSDKGASVDSINVGNIGNVMSVVGWQNGLVYSFGVSGLPYVSANISKSFPSSTSVFISGAFSDGFRANDLVNDCGNGAQTAAILELNNSEVRLAGTPSGYNAGDSLCRDATSFSQVVNSIDDTTNLTTYPLSLSDSDVNESFYSRVKYKDNGSTESDFSNWSGFTTKQSIIPAIGETYQGGYYAGQISDGGIIYNLIVAPVTSGQLFGQYGGLVAGALAYKTTSTNDPSSGNLYGNLDNGGPTTVALADGNHPIFDWCINTNNGPNAGNYDAGNNAGTGIGGFNDWYVPAMGELEIIYRNLKPSTDQNATDSGANNSAVPPTSNYTALNPGQTSVSVFQDGNSQAFSGNYYWSSSAIQPSESRVQAYSDGVQRVFPKTEVRSVRAIRREPA